MVMTVGSGYKAELQKDVGAVPVWIIDCDFSTGHRRFALWWHDVVWNGTTFFGLGQVENIGPSIADQSTVLTEEFLEFSVQNDPTLLADIMQNGRGRFCDRYLVMLGADGAPVNDEVVPVTHRRMFPGTATGDGDTYRAALSLESRFHRSRNRAARTYSHASQQHIDSSDFSLRDSGKQFDISRPDWRQRSGLAK